MKYRGATLIEVLITLLVISIGLLGIAVLQMTQLQQVSHANSHYLAQLQAQNIADRIRANPEGAENGNYSNISANPTEPTEDLCYNTSCNPTELASVDAYEWSQDNERLLPNGSGTVTSADNENFIITITWTHPDNTSINRTFNLNIPTD